MKEHKKAANQGKCTHSGITAHKEHCPLPVDWNNPQVLATTSHKNKNVLKYKLCLRESLKIQRHDSGPGRGLNEDWEGYVRSHAWIPVFSKM
jgi:hypothetical protein